MKNLFTKLMLTTFMFAIVASPSFAGKSYHQKKLDAIRTATRAEVKAAEKAMKGSAIRKAVKDAKGSSKDSSSSEKPESGGSYHEGAGCGDGNELGNINC